MISNITKQVNFGCTAVYKDLLLSGYEKVRYSN